MYEDFEDHKIYQPDQHTSYQFDAPFFGTPERTFETKPPRTVTSYRDDPFDVDEFLSYFYEFDDAVVYPRKMIEAAGKRARMFVPNNSQCDYLDGDDRKYARGLLVAHILLLTKRLKDMGGIPGGGGAGTSGMSNFGGNGVVTSASVGGVSVSMSVPQSASAWEFWLNQTQYGIQFQAFLSAHTPVGIYANGDDLRSCLRD